jgi:molybdenum cofactor cytidylyltransferase
VKTVCAILAAGRSTRMGEQKLLLPLNGATLLERALDAARDFPAIAVVAPELASLVVPRAGLQIVINNEPERGMAHSLALADAAVGDRATALVVLLADTPFVDAALVRRVVASLGSADVAYPVRAGNPGHPVAFGPRPRAELARWGDGDSLRRLRDDPRWDRREVPETGEAPFLDVDTPAEAERAREFAAEMEPARLPPKS